MFAPTSALPSWLSLSEQQWQLQILAANMSSLRKQVEDLRSGKGKEKHSEEKEEATPPLWLASVEELESAPHVHGGCRGNAICRRSF